MIFLVASVVGGCAAAAAVSWIKSSSSSCAASLSCSMLVAVFVVTTLAVSGALFSSRVADSSDAALTFASSWALAIARLSAIRPVRTSTEPGPTSPIISPNTALPSIGSPTASAPATSPPPPSPA